MPITCYYCGSDNPHNSQFCNQCGKTLLSKEQAEKQNYVGRCRFINCVLYVLIFLVPIFLAYKGEDLYWYYGDARVFYFYLVTFLLTIVLWVIFHKRRDG